MGRRVVFVYVFVMILLNSCYKGDRVKPAQVTPNEEEEQSYFVVNTLESELKVIEDSNGNGAGPTVRLLLNPIFNKTGKFKYQLFYHNYYEFDEYGIQKNQLYESPLLSVPTTRDFLGSYLINADSLLKLAQQTAEEYVFSIRFLDEKGSLIPIRNASSNIDEAGRTSLRSRRIETKEQDKKIQGRMDVYTTDNVDLNNNGYSAPFHKLILQYNGFPARDLACYVHLKYTSDQNRQDTIVYGQSDIFVLNQLTNYSEQIGVKISADTGQLRTGYYSFIAELRLVSTDELIAKDNFQASLEEQKADARTFQLTKWETDYTDQDNDGYCSSFRLGTQISASDGVSETYLAKVSYSATGLNYYNQLQQFTFTTGADRMVTVSAGDWLPKGFYDVKVEVYEFDASRAVSIRSPLAIFNALNVPSMQAIQMEMLGEDVP